MIEPQRGDTAVYVSVCALRIPRKRQSALYQTRTEKIICSPPHTQTYCLNPRGAPGYSARNVVMMAPSSMSGYEKTYGLHCLDDFAVSTAPSGQIFRNSR